MSILRSKAGLTLALCSVTLLALAAPQTWAAPPSGPAQYTTIAVPGASATSAFGLNNRGQVVGFYYEGTDYSHPHAFVYDHGVYTTLAVPGAENGAVALDVNERGQIVGYYFDANRVRIGFVYDQGVYTTFTAPGAGTGPFRGTFAAGINDRGQIVGFSIDSRFTAHSFLLSR